MAKAEQTVVVKSETENQMPSVEIIRHDIKDMIYVVRNQQVMLDSDLAMLYQVETKRLNETVKRNITRFPE